MKKFAFLVHPRDISDMARPLPWIRFVPNRIQDVIIRNLRGRSGFIVWSKFNVYDKAEGWIIFVSLTGEQIMSLPRNYVQRRILDAILYAQNNLGVQLVGLGAYTAPITDAGKWVIRQNQIKLNVTHGDSFSVAIAMEGIEKVAKKINRPLSESKIAVVGAYGLIGKALSRLLANKCKSLYLIGRNEFKLSALCNILESASAKIIPSLIIEDISDCDYIITATSYSKSLIQSSHLKQGAVVYDLAQPINLHPHVIKDRPDVARIDGCYTNIPGINLGVEMGPPAGTTFSCLAETIMQALEGEEENHVGEIELDHVQKTRLWAQKYGFTHADFTNYGNKLVI